VNVAFLAHSSSEGKFVAAALDSQCSTSVREEFRRGVSRMTLAFSGASSMSDHPGEHARHQAGRWLPHQDALEDWLEGLVSEVRSKADEVTLHPVIDEFRQLIDGDPVVRMYLTQMIEQVPHAKRYSKRHLESVDQMLDLINEVIGRAPEYNETGLVGVPLNAVLDWCMGTPAGFAAFRHPPINVMLKRILTAWCDFLSSPASLYVINDSPRGWKCASAKKSTKIEQFQYKPREKHWGFASWNDYFIRSFKPGQRPIADPEDDRVIVNACESTPYALKTNVQRQDRFWVKSQPYSLQDMLAGNESVDQFVGGTVYQAFLDAHNYHRWHSPVTGTVRRAFVQEGTVRAIASSSVLAPSMISPSQRSLSPTTPILPSFSWGRGSPWPIRQPPRGGLPDRSRQPGPAAPVDQRNRGNSE
jgi:phosphatidylserine decarboxylase